MSTAFSLAQLRASLWAEGDARVHAVVDGAVVPGVAKSLAAADVGGWDCLRRGALSSAEAEAATYLAELRPQSPFTDWLLGEAPTAWPGWGVLSVSPLALLPMREHCRSLSEVLTPAGEHVRWRWHDPDVLRAILPLLSIGQLDEVFAPGQQLVVAEASGWTFLSLRDGTLASDVRPLMQPTR